VQNYTQNYLDIINQSSSKMYTMSLKIYQQENSSIIKLSNQDHSSNLFLFDSKNRWNTHPMAFSI